MFVNSISTQNKEEKTGEISVYGAYVAFYAGEKKTDLRSGICHINRLAGIKIIAKLSSTKRSTMGTKMW